MTVAVTVREAARSYMIPVREEEAKGETRCCQNYPQVCCGACGARCWVEP